MNAHINAHLPAVLHGGDLIAAAAAFPGAPHPWIDLSTGINPWPWPVRALPADLRHTLPSPAGHARMVSAAAKVFGVSDAALVTATPGTQAAIQWLAHLTQPGRVAVLGPTYAEHARAFANAGHDVATVSDLEALDAADIGIVVNPNNPTGRIIAPADLLALADGKAKRGGVLIVDEAFADVTPGISIAAEAGRPGLALLRSFGKFFGLAGIRLGFVLADRPLSMRLAAALGPWAVSGEACAIGAEAYADTAWHEATRARLTGAAVALGTMLDEAGLERLGGTDLFRLARTENAARLFARLGQAGLWVRRFDTEPEWLRFGLPPDDMAALRLREALGSMTA